MNEVRWRSAERTDEMYRRARAKARRRPAWLLRRREAQIVARRPRPSDDEIIELCAIRRVLGIRSIRPMQRWRWRWRL